jgi:hypothetical protein
VVFGGFGWFWVVLGGFWWFLVVFVNPEITHRMDHSLHFWESGIMLIVKMVVFDGCEEHNQSDLLFWRAGQILVHKRI